MKAYHTIIGGFEMNKHRALEIAASPDLKNVIHNGNQVYIQHVDQKTNTARIYSLNNPGNEYVVQLESLHEIDR